MNPAKLYVGNLPYTITVDQLKELFGQFGQIVDATIISDKFSGRSKGFGFVEMDSEENAKAAIEKLNQSDYEGRKLIVNVARPMEPRNN